MITTEVKMAIHLTTNSIICLMCNLANKFAIKVIEHNGNYYYSEVCPRERCGHTEEFKLINGREAKRYIDIPAEDPFAQ